MLPDRVSNPGPLTYESGALPIELRGPANGFETKFVRPQELAVLSFFFQKIICIFLRYVIRRH